MQELQLGENAQQQLFTPLKTIATVGNALLQVSETMYSSLHAEFKR